MTMLRSLALLGALWLCGCSAPETLYAGSDGIVFNDPNTHASPAVLRVAEAHCERLGKRVQVDDAQPVTWYPHQHKFRCID